MKELLTGAMKKFYEETVRKDMTNMGFENPQIKFWGYDDDAPYPEDNPTLHGWVTANNYSGEVKLDLIAGDISYSGCCGIQCYL